jgi:aquaporin Z
MPRKLAAEAIGTFLLVFFAVGSAIFGAKSIGAAGVATAFGFVLLAIVYAIGPVSGAHVNPAVTLGVVLSRRMSPAEGLAYWVAQAVGGIAAGGLLKALVSDSFGKVRDNTGALGTNGYASAAHPISQSGAFVLEIVLTFLLVLVVLLVTGRAAAPGFAGLAIGLSLTVIHLVGIPLTGTSVNPARSFGPAIFEGDQALSQLWLFLTAPLVGGILAAIVWYVIRTPQDAAPAPSLEATEAASPSVARG